MNDVDQSTLPDAAPPVWARIAAVSSIVIAGLAGGLIGYSILELQCEGCTTGAAIAGLVGAVVCAGGVAVVAVLTLRAMSEWKAIENRDLARRSRGLT